MQSKLIQSSNQLGKVVSDLLKQRSGNLAQSVIVEVLKRINKPVVSASEVAKAAHMTPQKVGKFMVGLGHIRVRAAVEGSNQWVWVIDGDPRFLGLSMSQIRQALTNPETCDMVQSSTITFL